MKTLSFLGYEFSELKARGAFETAKEIVNQPKLWLETYDFVAQQQSRIEDFLKQIYTNDKLDIFLTGAGSSAFIGNILQGPFQRNSGKHIVSVATTDLVSHPEDYFQRETPTLLISFARSGNSPESVAAVNLANSICKKAYHLIITCNPSGELAKSINKSHTLIFLLPPEAEDKSLAMTGSFTSMLLAGFLISRIHVIDSLKSEVEQLSIYGERILTDYIHNLYEVAKLDFHRAVFLGSGPLQGTARESQLKLQELTDGKIICKNDSFLGFRHGPKVVINASTLLVYLFSNSEYVHSYEKDLVNTINDGEKGLFRIGVIESKEKAMDLDLDLVIVLSNGSKKIDEEFLSICSVLPGQILGFFKSLNLNLKPDSPSVNGSITRVVEGVTIYPYNSVIKDPLPNII